MLLAANLLSIFQLEDKLPHKDMALVQTPTPSHQTEEDYEADAELLR